MSKQQVTFESTHNNFSIYTNADKKQGCYTKQLDASFNQLIAMLSHHSRVTLIRFDLHLIGNNRYEDSKVIRKFFNLLTQHLKTKTKVKKAKPYRNHKRVAYGWVFEIEKKKKGHYHCWIAVDGHKIKYSGTTESWSDENKGLMGLVSQYWEAASNGGHIPPLKNPVYNIKRDDPISLDAAIYRISYLYKNRGKQYGKKGKTRNYGTSKVQFKEGVHLPFLDYEFTEEERSLSVYKKENKAKNFNNYSSPHDIPANDHYACQASYDDFDVYF